MSFKEIIKIVKDAITGKDVELTSGSIRKALFILAIPVIIEMIMESLFAIVDIYFVAKVSNSAITTIGNTEGVLMLIESVALGIGMGVTAMIARRVGEGNNERASLSAAQAILVAALISFSSGILCFIYAEDILRFLTRGNEVVVSEGKEYTRLILSLNFILMFLFVFNAIFRAAGNAVFAMRTLWLSNGINIILDPILILGIGSFEGYGVTGAAIATCIGRGVGLCYQLYILINVSQIIKIAGHHLRPKLDLIKDLIKLSSGTTGQFLIGTASWIFLIYILNDFGEDKFSGYTIALRVVIFTILPSWGLAIATATLVGQNLGAKAPERAEKTVWLSCKVNLIYLLILAVIFFIFAKQIIGVFSTDSVVISEGVLCLKILCLGYLFFAYEMIILQGFNGAGDTITPTIVTFVTKWLFQIPVAYILSKSFLQSSGVYIAISLSSLFAALMAIYLFKKGRWKAVVI